MLVISIVFGILLVLFLMDLSSRVSKLEGLLRDKLVSPQGSPHDNSVKSPTVTQAAAVQKPSFVAQTREPDFVDRFTAWLKEEWLMKLGALFLLMGLGWFVRYAFLHNWIGPYGRITLGLLAGTIILVLGWLRIQKYETQGGVLTVLGSTSIIFTLFAAREVYDFFTPLTALSIMFLSTVLVALASIKFKVRWLSLASLLLAGLAPMFTNPPKPDVVGLFWYLMVVTLGSIWVTVLTGYKEMTFGALVLVFLYSIPQFMGYQSQKDVLLIFAYAFAIIFFITNTAAILKTRSEKIEFDLITAGGNGLLLLAWILYAADPDLKSLIISAWMVVFALGAFMAFRATGQRVPFYIYGGVALMFLASATSSELNGSTLTIAYTIETGIVSAVLYGVLRDLKVIERAHLLFFGPGLLSLGSIFSINWHRGVFHKDFWVLFVLSALLLGLGWFYRSVVKKVLPEMKNLYIIPLIVGSVYAYILVWLSSKAGLRGSPDTAVMISLVLYTIIGLIKYFYGIAKTNTVLRNYGIVMLVLVVARLLLIDVWKMELVGKVITFLFIGTLLLSTALYSRKKIFQNKLS